MDMHFCPGALHMHTLHSDGTGTVEQLALAARTRGLQWIVITDHDTLAPAPSAGWLHGVLVIVGHEITLDHNHFLALNVGEVVDNALTPQDFVDAVYARGGFGIIAHPDEQVANHFKDIYRWDDWEVDGPRQRDGKPVGIELWNLMSDWGEHLTRRNKELLYFFPRLGAERPDAQDAGVVGPAEYLGQAHVWCRRRGRARLSAARALGPDRGVRLPLDFWHADQLPAAGRASGRRRAARHHTKVYAALAAGRSYFLNRLDGDCSQLLFHLPSVWASAGQAAAPAWAIGPLTLAAGVGRSARAASDPGWAACCARAGRAAPDDHAAGCLPPGSLSQRAAMSCIATRFTVTA